MLPFLLYACSFAIDSPKIVEGPVFEGRCDASAFVFVGADRILVADDEKKSLGLFALTGGRATKVSVKSHVGVDDELDLEGAASIGDVAYFIGSHGRTASGKLAPARAHLFALHPGEEPIFVGRSANTLMPALFGLPEIGARLREAAQRPPKSREGGLNIEGLASSPEGALLIGLRNPLIEGQAVVVTLSNPRSVLEGEAPKVESETIDLGGRGIRGIQRMGSEYLIVAGPIDSETSFALFRWNGETVSPIDVDLGELNPEAVGLLDGRILLLSDDGREPVAGMPCKDADADLRSFRSAWLRL
jgi:hypothetical protein